MKIQYIAVIFVIIILPISIILTASINSQIDTINLQTSYNAKLTDSTYDAVKAFQINTVNNRYSSVSDSKIRDIEAAVSTFYTSLSNNEDLAKEELKAYAPALVFTLYDGYYIYSKYDNVYIDVDEEGNITNNNDGQPITDTEVLKAEGYTNYGLKPYIYYSCRYKDGSRDFVVNYTLDNAITIYGTFSGEYKTLSGYLINPDAVSIDSDYEATTPQTWYLTYDGVEIGPEILTEHLLFATKDADGNYEQGDYDYLVHDGQKIYYDRYKTGGGSSETKYFLYQNYDKVYITNSYANTELVEYLRKRTGETFSLSGGTVTYFNNDGRLHSTSSFEYYYQAKSFSKEVNSLTSGITQKHAVDENGTLIEFSVNTKDEVIFAASNTNDPLLSYSAFNENRRAVIRKSIETNLTAAIANYNIYSGNNYEFALPELTETDWEKITNKVSMISFLQGIPIGHKYYNNYCVITNDNNEETINKENIYIVTENVSTGEREYHLPGCHHLAETTDSEFKIIDAYSNLSFIRQTVRISEGNYIYFYPQTRTTNKNITACYHCIVNAANVYKVDEIIEGQIWGKDVNWNDTIIIDISKAGEKTQRIKTIRTYYIKALARERYDLYQTNMDLFNEE